MAGKKTLKSELIEELMEGKSILNNFAEEVGIVLGGLDLNEAIDHRNDGIRNEVMNFLLKGMEAYDAKDYEGMQKYLHAATQKLNEQGVTDLKDDKPRTDAKIKLLRTQMSAIHSGEKITRLLAKLGEKK